MSITTRSQARPSRTFLTAIHAARVFAAIYGAKTHYGGLESHKNKIRLGRCWKSKRLFVVQRRPTFGSGRVVARFPARVTADKLSEF